MVISALLLQAKKKAPSIFGIAGIQVAENPKTSTSSPIRSTVSCSYFVDKCAVQVLAPQMRHIPRTKPLK